jgi:hypothetical protein
VSALWLRASPEAKHVRSWRTKVMGHAGGIGGAGPCEVTFRLRRNARTLCTPGCTLVWTFRTEVSQRSGVPNHITSIDNSSCWCFVSWHRRAGNVRPHSAAWKRVVSWHLHAIWGENRVEMKPRFCRLNHDGPIGPSWTASSAPARNRSRPSFWLRPESVHMLKSQHRSYRKSSRATLDGEVRGR